MYALTKLWLLFTLHRHRRNFSNYVQEVKCTALLSSFNQSRDVHNERPIYVSGLMKIQNWKLLCLSAPSFAIILSSKYIKIDGGIYEKLYSFLFKNYINLTKNYDTFSRSLKHKKIHTILATSSVLPFLSFTKCCSCVGAPSYNVHR